MRGIKDRVAIIGMGCTKFGERWDTSAADLMVEASYEAFADAVETFMLNAGVVRKARARDQGGKEDQVR